VILVSSFNRTARRFYLRQGFGEIGAIEALASAKSTGLLLRKALSGRAGKVGLGQTANLIVRPPSRVRAVVARAWVAESPQSRCDRTDYLM